MALTITPQTRVGELLEHYPHLEEVLIAFSPGFAKLKNPVLRKTVGRVATLEQAAGIAGVSAPALVAALRHAAGEDAAEAAHHCDAGPEGVPAEPPAWAEGLEFVETFDADQMLDAGEHPLGKVMSASSALEAGQGVLILSSFQPAPLIEMLESKGYQAACALDTDGRIRTFIALSDG